MDSLRISYSIETESSQNRILHLSKGLLQLFSLWILLQLMWKSPFMASIIQSPSLPPKYLDTVPSSPSSLSGSHHIKPELQHPCNAPSPLNFKPIQAISHIVQKQYFQDRYTIILSLNLKSFQGSQSPPG